MYAIKRNRKSKFSLFFCESTFTIFSMLPSLYLRSTNPRTKHSKYSPECHRLKCSSCHSTRISVTNSSKVCLNDTVEHSTFSSNKKTNLPFFQSKNHFKTDFTKILNYITFLNVLEFANLLQRCFSNYTGRVRVKRPNLYHA